MSKLGFRAFNLGFTYELLEENLGVESLYYPHLVYSRIPY